MLSQMQVSPQTRLSLSCSTHSHYDGKQPCPCQCGDHFIHLGSRHERPPFTPPFFSAKCSGYSGLLLGDSIDVKRIGLIVSIYVTECLIRACVVDNDHTSKIRMATFLRRCCAWAAATGVVCPTAR